MGTIDARNIMNKTNYLAKAISVPIFFGIMSFVSGRANATKAIEVICDTTLDSPTVTATMSNPRGSQGEAGIVSRKTEILSFLPQYFSAEEAADNCRQTALSLQSYYSQDKMNYLASDTINGKPVVCAVERRGISCDGYRSEILFSLDKTVNPSQLLYDMLGGNFKDNQIPSSRTVSRIYTDLRPTWWPF